MGDLLVVLTSYIWQPAFNLACSPRNMKKSGGKNPNPSHLIQDLEYQTPST